jgi:hypothetical protein
MALAIKFDQMIRDGVVKDQAELARLGFITRARVTQIMNLLNLTPALQQTLLTGEAEDVRTAAVTERELRRIVNILDWRRQEANWRLLRASSSPADGRPS